MTKLPRAVAREALRLAREALPAYSSLYSRKDFTQHQPFAVLALKTFLKTDSRGVVQLLADFAELPADLGLTKVPSRAPSLPSPTRRDFPNVPAAVPKAAAFLAIRRPAG